MLQELALLENHNDQSSQFSSELCILGQSAIKVAQMSVFSDYRSRKSPHTIRRQISDLSLFAEYLNAKGVALDVDRLMVDPQSWRWVTWGFVAGFLRWQLHRGYAVSSVNVRLSTIKVYAKLAFKAGSIGLKEYALIKSIDGYTRREAKRIDEQRRNAGVRTRIGYKKANPTRITTRQAKRLKVHPDTPQGRRDALLMCLMLDHGLRVGEVALLQVENLNLDCGELSFYRPKVDMTQTHRLSPDTFKAAEDYRKNDASDSGLLLKGSINGGELKGGMTNRAITMRVRTLGKRIGIEDLSAHDCRHYWVTRAARGGTPIDRLMDAGGWASPTMPLRYIKASQIANEGVRLE